MTATDPMTDLVLAVQNADLLRRLAQDPAPDSAAALAREYGRDKSNFAKTLGLLRGQGWVDEAALALTAAGRALLPRLNALEGVGTPDTPPQGGLLLLTRDQLRPSPDNPRRDFDSDEARAAHDHLRMMIVLAGDVRQNLLVGPADANGVREIIAGERRYRAACEAIDEDDLPADFRFPCRELVLADAAERLEEALVENLARRDLSHLEEGEAYRKLHREHGRSTAQIADRFNCSQKHVQNHVALIEKLPASDQARMRLDKDDPDHLSYAQALRSIQQRKPGPDLAAEVVLALVEIADRVARGIGKHPYRPDRIKLERPYPYALVEALQRAGLITRHGNGETWLQLEPEGCAWLVERSLWPAPAGVRRDQVLAQARRDAGVELEEGEEFATEWLRRAPAKPEPAAVELSPQARLALMEISVKRQLSPLTPDGDEIGDWVAISGYSYLSTTWDELQRSAVVDDRVAMVNGVNTCLTRLTEAGMAWLMSNIGTDEPDASDVAEARKGATLEDGHHLAAGDLDGWSSWFLNAANIERQIIRGGDKTPAAETPAAETPAAETPAAAALFGILSRPGRIALIELQLKILREPHPKRGAACTAIPERGVDMRSTGSASELVNRGLIAISRGGDVSAMVTVAGRQWLEQYGPDRSSLEALRTERDRLCGREFPAGDYDTFWLNPLPAAEPAEDDAGEEVEDDVAEPGGRARTDWAADGATFARRWIAERTDGEETWDEADPAFAAVVAAFEAGRLVSNRTLMGQGPCRVCGCTEHDACDGGCGWAEKGLCDACSPYLAARPAQEASEIEASEPEADATVEQPPADTKPLTHAQRVQLELLGQLGATSEATGKSAAEPGTGLLNPVMLGTALKPRGLVDSARRKPASGPQITLYWLTPAGVARLQREAALSAAEETPDHDHA